VGTAGVGVGVKRWWEVFGCFIPPPPGYLRALLKLGPNSPPAPTNTRTHARTHARHTPDPTPPQVKHVSGACLVEHAPSPQACALRGRVWDDRFAGSSEMMGGRCITAWRAALLAGAGVEEVAVEVSHDTGERLVCVVGGWERGLVGWVHTCSSDTACCACADRHKLPTPRSLARGRQYIHAGMGMPKGPLRLRCLRLADRAEWGAMGAYFPPGCAAPMDGGGEDAGTAAS